MISMFSFFCFWLLLRMHFFIRTKTKLLYGFLYCYFFLVFKTCDKFRFANQVKTNMCSVSVKLFMVLTTFVALFTLNWYNTNYNNNCLFNTTIRYSAPNRNSVLELLTQLVTRLLQLQLTDWSLYFPLL